MTQEKKYPKDFEDLLEAIRQGWAELALSSLTPEDRAGTKKHIAWCLDELQKMFRESIDKP